TKAPPAVRYLQTLDVVGAQAKLSTGNLESRILLWQLMSLRASTINGALLATESVEEKDLRVKFSRDLISRQRNTHGDGVDKRYFESTLTEVFGTRRELTRKMLVMHLAARSELVIWCTVKDNHNEGLRHGGILQRRERDALHVGERHREVLRRGYERENTRGREEEEA
ncbi:hypothetical protein SCHPADRAFT_897614, partial [Schizopora paradoxa]